MFKLRHIIQIFLLLLSTGCGSVGTAAPTTPPIAPSMTLLPSTPTRVSPTSTPALPMDNVVGLIAYASDQDGDFEIWVMNADGSDQHKLTDNSAVDSSPAWSPDGSQIAFISNRDGNDEVYIMNADGRDVRRLTQAAGSSESFPAWSPDGMQISFDSDRGGDWDIHVMGSDGADPARLTDSPGDDWISSWSPDGSRIVFESKRDGNYEIYAMDSDGSHPRRLDREVICKKFFES